MMGGWYEYKQSPESRRKGHAAALFDTVINEREIV
jgi:hypothetical protein